MGLVVLGNCSDGGPSSRAAPPRTKNVACRRLGALFRRGGWTDRRRAPLLLAVCTHKPRMAAGRRAQLSGCPPPRRMGVPHGHRTGAAAAQGAPPHAPALPPSAPAPSPGPPRSVLGCCTAGGQAPPRLAPPPAPRAPPRPIERPAPSPGPPSSGLGHSRGAAAARPPRARLWRGRAGLPPANPRTERRSLSAWLLSFSPDS